MLLAFVKGRARAIRPSLFLTIEKKKGRWWATQLHFFVSCFVPEKEVVRKKTDSRYLHHTILSYPYPTLPPYLIHTPRHGWKWNRNITSRILSAARRPACLSWEDLAHRTHFVHYAVSTGYPGYTLASVITIVSVLIPSLTPSCLLATEITVTVGLVCKRAIPHFSQEKNSQPWGRSHQLLVIKKS